MTDSDRHVIIESRNRLFEFFKGMGVNNIKSPESYSDIDDSIFHQVDSDSHRQIYVMLFRGAKWGPGISHYIERSSEFTEFDTLIVESANSIENNLEKIYEMYVAWMLKGDDVS